MASLLNLDKATCSQIAMALVAINGNNTLLFLSATCRTMRKQFKNFLGSTVFIDCHEAKNRSPVRATVWYSARKNSAAKVRLVHFIGPKGEGATLAMTMEAFSVLPLFPHAHTIICQRIHTEFIAQAFNNIASRRLAVSACTIRLLEVRGSRVSASGLAHLCDFLNPETLEIVDCFIPLERQDLHIRDLHAPLPEIQAKHFVMRVPRYFDAFNSFDVSTEATHSFLQVLMPNLEKLAYHNVTPNAHESLSDAFAHNLTFLGIATRELFIGFAPFSSKTFDGTIVTRTPWTRAFYPGFTIYERMRLQQITFRITDMDLPGLVANIGYFGNIWTLCHLVIHIVVCQCNLATLFSELSAQFIRLGQRLRTYLAPNVNFEKIQFLWSVGGLVHGQEWSRERRIEHREALMYQVVPLASAMRENMGSWGDKSDFFYDPSLRIDY